MSATFLDMIVRKTRIRVQELKDRGPDVRASAERVRDIAVRQRFRSVLERSDRINIIAEIKRASPSKGVIKADIDAEHVARTFESGGAAAISVLTENEYFGGSMEDLESICSRVDIPVLRKDFIVDEYQIYEAAAAGAEAVLLIVAALSAQVLKKLLRLACDLGMDAIVEVHTLDEMAIADQIGAEIIGVNNRDLRSLEVSLDVSRKLVADRPLGKIMIAESGLSSGREIRELRDLGFDAFLIGESLMKTENIIDQLKVLAAGSEDLK